MVLIEEEMMGEPLLDWCTPTPSMEEVCSVSAPLVKVLRLVDSDKPTIGYLYDAMVRAKETIRTYYVGKGTLRYNKQMMLWDLIDSRWTKMLHRPIHATTLFFNPTFSYNCNFDFDGEVMGVLTHRLSVVTCIKIFDDEPARASDLLCT